MTTASRKVLITITKDEVAPRFDLASEVLIAEIDEQKQVIKKRTIVLPNASAEELCHMILAEKIDAVICSGIEDQYYQYLEWKRIEIFDSVIGPYMVALDRFSAGGLHAGDIIYSSE